jgi:putative ABC transport system ATP-binding protein
VSTAPGLELVGVTRSVPDGGGPRVILDGVDLSVGRGELVVVTGSSGSGKSTLLAIAGLLRRPDAGDVVIDGTSTEPLSKRARTGVRRRSLAFVYQSANLFPALTAVEQLEIVGRIRGERRAETRRRALALLDEVGMGGRAHGRPHELSGGERQRVGIARALMADPVVLLADEPTASLDPELAGEVADLLATQTRSRSLATVLVTHGDAPLAHADRHLHLSGGSLTPARVAPAPGRPPEPAGMPG